jgi:hypothetical protein
MFSLSFIELAKAVHADRDRDAERLAQVELVSDEPPRRPAQERP